MSHDQEHPSAAKPSADAEARGYEVTTLGQLAREESDIKHTSAFQELEKMHGASHSVILVPVTQTPLVVPSDLQVAADQVRDKAEKEGGEGRYTYRTVEAYVDALGDPDQRAVVQKAMSVAQAAHMGQYRKSSGTAQVPYIQHPIRVALTLAQHGLHPWWVAAALLHDVVEDTNVDAAELRENFYGDIVWAVEGCSELKRNSAGIKISWRARKLAAIRELYTVRWPVLAIKLADKLANLSDTREQLKAMFGETRVGPSKYWDQFGADFASQRWYYHASLDAFYYRLSWDLAHQEPGTRPCGTGLRSFVMRELPAFHACCRKVFGKVPERYPLTTLT